MGTRGRHLEADSSPREWALGFLEGSSQKPALVPECWASEIDLQPLGEQVGCWKGGSGGNTRRQKASTAGEVGDGVRGALAFKERTRETQLQKLRSEPKDTHMTDLSSSPCS